MSLFVLKQSTRLRPMRKRPIKSASIFRKSPTVYLLSVVLVFAAAGTSFAVDALPASGENIFGRNLFVAQGLPSLAGYPITICDYMTSLAGIAVRSRLAEKDIDSVFAADETAAGSVLWVRSIISQAREIDLGWVRLLRQPADKVFAGEVYAACIAARGW
jgi:hypothetical protein